MISKSQMEKYKREVLLNIELINSHAAPSTTMQETLIEEGYLMRTPLGLKLTAKGVRFVLPPERYQIVPKHDTWRRFECKKNPGH